MNNNIDFEKIIETVLPYFVEIWGEEYRDVIVSRLNRVIPLFITTIDGMKSDMFFQQSTKRIELTLKFLEEQGYTIPESLKEQSIKNRSMLYITDEFEEIKTFLNGCFSYNEFYTSVFGGIDDILDPDVDNLESKAYLYDNMIKTLDCFGIKVDDGDYPRWRKSEEAKPTLRRLASLQASISVLNREYEEFNTKFKSTEDTLNRAAQTRSKLNDRFFVDFLHSIEEYLTQDEINAITKFDPDNFLSLYKIKKECPIMELVGENFDCHNLYRAFTKEAEEQLANPDVGSFAKDRIIEDRIAYFEKKGLYDKSDPKTFLNSQVALTNWPSLAMAENITKKRNEYNEKMENELMRQFSSFDENVRTIDKAGLADKPLLKLKKFKNKTTCIIPSCKEVDGFLTEVPILCYFLGECLHEYKDVTLIHELNHAVELSVLEKDKEGNIHYKCGFEHLISTPNKEDEQDDDKDEKREYEIISETINQLIAIDITNMMHRDGVYIFDDPRIAKVEGGITYEHNNMFLIAPWKIFRQIIMNARIGRSLEELLSVVGKENFARLNGIIHEYGEINYYKLMDAIHNDKTTPLTEKFNALVDEAIELAKKMKEHAEEMGYVDGITQEQKTA